MLLFALLQAAAPVTPAPPQPAAPPPPWTVVTKANPDGSVLSAATAVRSADGKARLALRCDRAAETVVSLQFRVAGQAFVEDKPAQSVTVTVDRGTPFTGKWDYLAAAGVISEPGAITQLAVMLAAAKQVTVATSNGGAPVTATFDGPNGASAVRDVLGACGYVLGTVPPPLKPAKK